MAAAVRRAVSAMFQPRYLIWTNTGVSGLLMGLGDGACQAIERRMDGNTQESYDWRRTGKLTLIGLAMGPIYHGWYVFLDKVLPGKKLLTIGKKILADELVAAPFGTFVFFMGSYTLDGIPVKQSWHMFKQKFWPVYKVDLSVWPAAQLINFAFIPQNYRVLYVCSLTFCWNVFLSYMLQKDVPSKLEEAAHPSNPSSARTPSEDRGAKIHEVMTHTTPSTAASGAILKPHQS